MSATMPKHQLPDRMTPPWTNPAPLPDKPGGETNLLHRSAWENPGEPLRVEFKPWYEFPMPGPGSERVDVFLDDDESNIIGSRTWDLPMDPDDYYIEIPADKLPQGEHQIRYIMTNVGDVADRSHPYTVTIDKLPPELNVSSGLGFPSAVLPPNQLTARYLEQNDDQVKSNLPAYTSPRPWDRITWYWGPIPGSTQLGGVIELDDKNYDDPVNVIVEGDFIRDKGDGFRYAWYEVSDRAGNLSLRSDPVELDVSATPIPRTLPWPSVEKAVGNGELQSFDPFQGTAGAVVQVPDDAVIYPRERVWVQWGEPGKLGARRVEQPIIPGQRRYQIDMPAVAAHIGKVLPVSYGVIDEHDAVHPSVRRRLEVQTIPSNRFEAVRCDGLSGGSLSYKAVAAEGARLTLAKWSLITTDQWLMITMTGVSATGQDSVFEAVRKRAITTQEVVSGIGYSSEIRVSKAFLNTLRRNAPLTGKVYLSFDGGATWPPAPNFPLLQLTFID